MSADQSESELDVLFIRLRGRVQGPFSPEQLRSLHQRGQFSRAHEVSDDRVSWRSASSLSNVFVVSKGRPQAAKATTRPDPLDELDDVAGGSAVKSPAFLVQGPAKMVKPVWHYSVSKETYGPVTILELRGLLAGGQLMPTDLVWKDGLADWAPAGEVLELTGSTEPRSPSTARRSAGATNYCSACGNAMDSRAEICPHCGVRQMAPVRPKSRMATALLAIFLGSFGLHRFYLGHALAGLAYSFVWLLFMIAFVTSLMAREPRFALLCLVATALPWLISFVEGVIFLCMSDATFAKRYDPR